MRDRQIEFKFCRNVNGTFKIKFNYTVSCREGGSKIEVFTLLPLKPELNFYFQLQRTAGVN